MDYSYIYPALFHYNEDDGSYTITFPDLPGCISEGKDLKNALVMASDVLKQHIDVLKELKREIPPASSVGDISCDENEFVNLVFAEIKDTRAVKRTISLPKWMDERVIEEGLSLSRVTQEALAHRFA